MGVQPKFEQDHISQLPDELIIGILSRLSLQESGRTCVLSRRWEKLWLLTNHCSGPNLIFKTPIYKGLCHFDTDVGPRLQHRKRLLYIGLLNKVFMSHRQPLLDELVIKFCLNSKFSVDIDNWIKFAFTKGVQRLELDFFCSSSTTYTDYYGPENPYVFPSLHNERMRVLCLKGVYVDQRVIDALLSTFPLLENLSLKPRKLRHLTFSSAKLKHLELSSHDYTANHIIEISAPNLISLGYEGRTRALHLRCIPRLLEFYVWDRDSDFPFFMKNDLHLSYISQLKKLKLKLGLDMFMKCPSYPLAFPQLIMVEELEVDIIGIDGYSFLWPIVFIKAFPSLRRFAIRMTVYFLKDSSTRHHSEGDKSRIKDATKFRHESLKVVEINGFYGSSTEIEVAQQLFDIGAQSLEKVVIVIDTRWPANGAKEIAQRIGQELDSRIDFVLL